jgi:magnesium chelatase family protein
VLRRRFRLDAVVMAPLKFALERGLISIRGVDRSLRVAWTLGDLAGRTAPNLDDVTTALSFRQAEVKL